MTGVFEASPPLPPMPPPPPPPVNRNVPPFPPTARLFCSVTWLRLRVPAFTKIAPPSPARASTREIPPPAAAAAGVGVANCQRADVVICGRGRGQTGAGRIRAHPNKEPANAGGVRDGLPIDRRVVAVDRHAPRVGQW